MNALIAITVLTKANVPNHKEIGKLNLTRSYGN